MISKLTQNEAQLNLQNQKAEADRRQAEMKYLGEFLSFALEDDIHKRLRFAEYFAYLTISEDLQVKWKVYNNKLILALNAAQKLEADYATAEATGDSEEVAKLRTKLIALRPRVDSLDKPNSSVCELPPERKNVRPATPHSRRRMFSAIDFEPAPIAGNREAIEILGNWEQFNIKTVFIPQLKGISVFGRKSSGKTRFNKAAEEQLKALWAAWEAAGVLDQVLSFEGAYYSRLVRGSKTTLTPHSYGAAFDINARWNKLGECPAAAGMKGSVIDLVSIANDYGFFWGGHNKHQPDGMHFEVFKLY